MGFLVGGIAWIGFYLLLRNHGKLLLSLPGSGVFSAILELLGIGLLIWNETVSRVLYRALYQPWSPFTKFVFGKRIVSEADVWFLRFYRAGVIFVGVSLLIGAWANYFGPVSQ